MDLLKQCLYLLSVVMCLTEVHAIPGLAMLGGKFLTDPGLAILGGKLLTDMQILR